MQIWMCSENISRVKVVVYDIDTKKRVAEKGVEGYEVIGEQGHEGSVGQELKTLTLSLYRHYYDYLVNPTLAFPEVIEKHKACNICGKTGASHYNECEDNKKDWHECVQCYRWYPTKECFEFHKTKSERQRQSNCEKYWKCRDCGMKQMRKLRKPGEHVCGESRCNNCKEWVTDLTTSASYNKKSSKHFQKNTPFLTSRH